MKGDNPVLLDINGLTETEDVPAARAEPSTYIWKRTGALLTITLCFSAAIFFTFHSKEHHHAVEADDLHHSLRQISGRTRAAIHVEGYFNKNLEKLEWIQGVGNYHAEGGLRLDHNEIVIPRSGLYFVYSQASFRVGCHLDQHLDDEDIVARKMVHVSHAVKLWSPSWGPQEDKNYETILHSVRTGCEKKASDNPEDDDKWYGSVYIGAVFNVHKGDRLKTVVDKKWVDESGIGNTFGVFAL